MKDFGHGSFGKLKARRAESIVYCSEGLEAGKKSREDFIYVEAPSSSARILSETHCQATTAL